MEELISKWVRETIAEYESAKKNLNPFRMNEMLDLRQGLIKLRDNLLRSRK
jgi:hypothetical protein